MTAYGYWQGADFGLLEYLSVLSTAHNTTAPAIEVFFDEADPPRGAHWSALDDIQRVAKRPAGKLLQRYAASYLKRDLPPALSAATVSDFFRYCHLYENGGLWFDFDAIQIRDVYQLEPTRDFLVGREDDICVSIAVRERSCCRRSTAPASWSH